MIKNRALLFVSRLILGGVFIYAGVLKIGDPVSFARNIAQYRLVPHALALFTAVVLPWLEILSGAFLILGVFKRTNALLISLMLAFFIVLVVITMIRGIDVDCGCFGAFSRQADWRLIVEDVLLLFMALNAAGFGKRHDMPTP